MIPAEFPPEATVVLIVDDAPANLALLSDTLHTAGKTVLVALDGESALERLRHITPDIILLDAIMPGMDGFDTCARIRVEPRHVDLPIVFMTALTETDDVVKGFRVGGTDYVTKPIRPAEVLARIDAHVQRARAQRQACLAARAPRVEPLPRVVEDSDESTVSGVISEQLGLTSREAEVLLWLSYGKTNRDIGEIVGMRPRTVNKHLEHVFAKLGVETRTAAAALAIRVRTSTHI